MRILENEDDDYEEEGEKPNESATIVPSTLRKQKYDQNSIQKKRGDSHVLDWKNYVKYNTADKIATCGDKVSFIQTVLR